VVPQSEVRESTCGAWMDSLSEEDVVGSGEECRSDDQAADPAGVRSAIPLWLEEC